MMNDDTQHHTENPARSAPALIAALAALLLLASCASALPTPRASSPSVPSGNGRGAGTVTRAVMSGEIRALLDDSLLAPSLIGIHIVALDDSALLFEQNSRKLFHPASNMKLLTTAAALHRLPPEFRFATSVTTAGTRRESTLAGDLVVRGSGDPLLEASDLDSLAEAIARSGIRVVEGDLLGDVSLFDSLAWGKGWMWDDEPGSDYPYLTPLTVHHNTLSIRVTPGKKEGHEPGISADPITGGVMLFNEAVTTSDTSLPRLAGGRIPGTNTFRITGRIAPGDSAARLELSVWKPEMRFLDLFRDRLAAHGVEIRGANLVWTTPPPGTDTLAVVTRSLDTVLAAINKVSDNLAAELLLKNIAAAGGERPASAAGGLMIVKGYLAEAGVDTSLMILADGSGVSWYNAFSPEAMTRLLLAEYGNRATFPRFRESLPVAGVDGTLRSRMRGTPAEGNAAAKTGTLTGVSTLSGYVTSADGRPIGFSILSNHFPGQVSVLRTLQNTLVELLARTALR